MDNNYCITNTEIRKRVEDANRTIQQNVVVLSTKPIKHIVIALN